MATATDSVLKPDHGAKRDHFLFTDEHEDLRESMKAWVLKECTPNRFEWEENLWPDSILKRAADLGYVGLCYPEEYGGQGGDYFYSLVRADAMSYSGCGGLNMGFAVHTDMATPPIHLLGTEEQKQRYLVPSIKGELISSLGITEPGAGSDVAGIRTTAKRDGDEWVINGSKTFITNGLRANYIVLVAKTDPDKGHDGISLFIVDIRDKDGNEVDGFSVSRKLEKMGMHASDTGELSFQDVRVPAENLLGQEGKGFYHISWELQGERLVAAIGCVSGAERVFDRTLEYAKEREAFGRPIGKLPGDPPQVRRDVGEDRGRQADGLHDRLALRQRRVPGPRDHPGEALRLTSDRGGRRRVHPDPRRLRLHEGVRGRARLPRLAPQPDRRRHRRDHARGDRPLVRALAL